MGIVATCPISLKMTPLKERGVLVPVSQAKFVGLAWPCIGIEYQLLLTYTEVINKESPSLIQACARVSEKQEMAENLVFGALPLVLGVPNFPKLV